MGRGIGLDLFSLNSEGGHPFVRAVIASREASEPRSAIRDVLSQYYNVVTTDNAAQWVGLRDDNTHELWQNPPWARVWPWQSKSIEMRRREARRHAPLESKMGDKQLTIEDGWKKVGPVSPAMLDVETTRLYKLIRSIETRGYQRDDSPTGDINVSVLWTSEDRWRWKIGGGEHRAAVLAGLGHDTVPIRVRSIIRRDEVELWPNVASGLYTPEAALDVFDRLVDDEPPEIARSWKKNHSPQPHIA